MKLTMLIVLYLNSLQAGFAAPLGPNPLYSFEGRIDYQANAETLLNCNQPVCDSGLGSSGSSCLALSESQFDLQNIPEQTPNFRLIYADLSWAASEGLNNQLDTDVTLTTPSGDVISVTASEESSESFTDGMPMCQQLIPFICSEAPTNLSCDLQFYAHHADLTEELGAYHANGGFLNGAWSISDVTISGSAITDPQTAIAAVGGLTIGAWSLLLIYESSDLPSRKIYYYQGLELNEGVNRQLFPRGFIAPPNPTVDLTLMVLEGDQQISGDQLLLNGRQITDQCNPANNVFNSTVSSNNECRQNVTGVDLDRFVVEGAIEEGDTEAELELVIPMGNGFTTAGEQLFTHWLVLSFDHLLPTFDQLKPEKRSDPPHEQAVALDEVITYEIQLQNIGEAPATNVILRDLTPHGTSYIVGSATVDMLPINDGPQDSNPFAAGLNLNELPQVGDRIEVNEGHSIRFQVRVMRDPDTVIEVINIAEISADRIEPTLTNIVRHPIDLTLEPPVGGEEAGSEMTGGEMTGGEMTGGEMMGGEISSGDMGGVMMSGAQAGEEQAGEERAGEERAGEDQESGGLDRSGEMTQPGDYCGEGTRFNEERQLCESICGPGLRWDSTCDPSRCVQESEPPCDEDAERKRRDEGCQSQSLRSSPLTSLVWIFFILWGVRVQKIRIIRAYSIS